LVELTPLDSEQMSCAFFLLRRDLLAAATTAATPSTRELTAEQLARAEPGWMHRIANALGRAFLSFWGADAAAATEDGVGGFVDPDIAALCERAGLKL
jgi:hypothetical protein